MTGSDVLGVSEVSGWDVAIAVAVIVGSVVAARLTFRAMLRVGGRLEGVSAGARRTAATITAYFVLLIGLGIALGALGADVQPLQTAAIIVAIIAFVALRGVAGQYVAGIVLRATHPYRVGDHIESGGHVGVVRQITAVATVIEAYDGRLVHVPNLQAVSSPIVNRTATGALRADVEVRAIWTGEAEQLLRTIREAAAGAPDVLTHPETLVGVRAAEPDRITALVRPWYQPQLDGDLVAGAVAATVSQRLKELGVAHTVITPPPPPPFTPMAQV